MHLTSIRIDSQRFPDRSSYPFNLALLQNTPELSLTTPVTFFAGENGSGKSTLLRALARKCSINIWGGNDRQRVAAGRYEDSLHHMLEVTWRNGTVPGSFFSSQVFQNFARMLDEWAVTDPGLLQYFGGQSLMNLSHGQSLMAFFRSRYRIRGLYLLDEPETALSPASQLDLLRLLIEAGQKGRAQFVIATHSPILLACPGAEILNFDGEHIAPIGYEDTAYYRVYRDFLLDRERFLAGSDDETAA
jgi:predicted ATPase